METLLLFCELNGNSFGNCFMSPSLLFKTP